MSPILLLLLLTATAAEPEAAIAGCSQIAHDSYLEGQLLLGKRTSHDLEAALAHFDRAIATDPDCAPAFAGRARAHALLYEYLEAREAALAALELDPDLSEAHAALGFVRLQADWDRKGAEESLRRAVALDPGDSAAHHWLAICLEVSGRVDEAIAQARQALELEPAAPLYQLNLGYRLFWARRYEEAVEQFLKTLAMEPDLASAHYFRGRALVEQREYAEAMAAYEAAEKLSPGDWNLLSARGYLHAKAGRRHQALAVAAELESYVARGYPFRSQVASIYSALGESEQALARLERAVEAREGALLWLSVDPRFDPLRSDPRFAELLERLDPKP